MRAAQVMVHGDNAVWTGSLREFFRTNEYDLADARPVTAELRKSGCVLIGGGAAPTFKVVLREQISCGCCRGPVTDRCCCLIHADIPRGLQPHKCSLHHTK